VSSPPAAVHGLPATFPVAEDSPTLPINPYGVSKPVTEMMPADAAIQMDGVANFGITALASGGFVPVVVVLEADDVILAEVTA
jgi:hypothetical protein